MAAKELSTISTGFSTTMSTEQFLKCGIMRKSLQICNFTDGKYFVDFDGCASCIQMLQRMPLEFSYVTFFRKILVFRKKHHTPHKFMDNSCLFRYNGKKKRRCPSGWCRTFSRRALRKILLPGCQLCICAHYDCGKKRKTRVLFVRKRALDRSRSHGKGTGAFPHAYQSDYPVTTSRPVRAAVIRYIAFSAQIVFSGTLYSGDFSVFLFTHSILDDRISNRLEREVFL